MEQISVGWVGAPAIVITVQLKLSRDIPDEIEGVARNGNKTNQWTDVI